MGRISPELVLVDSELGELLRELLPEPGDCLAPRPALQPSLTPVAIAPVVRVPPSALLQSTPTTAAVDSVVPVAVPLPVPARPRTVPPRPRRARPRSRTQLLAWVAVAGVLASPLLAFVTVTDYPPFPAVPPSASSGADGGPASTAGPSATGAEPSGATSKPAVKGTSAASKASASRTARPSKPSPSASQKQATDGPSASTPDSGRALIDWPREPTAVFYSLILVRAGERLDFRAPTNLVELRSDGKRPAVVYHWFVYPAFGSASKPTYGRLLADGTVRLSPGSIRLG